MEHGISKNKYTSWAPNPDMECPGCGKVSFEHTDTLVGDGKRTLEYKCECGELGYFNETTQQTQEGVDEFIKEIGGYSAVDMLGKIDLIRAAFVSGRAFQSKESLKDLKILNQAE